MPTNIAHNHIVAVYGTLREGSSNHTLISECKRIGRGWLTGFRMYNLGNYPGIISTYDDSGRIRVEWYDVSDDILKKLDALEQYDPEAATTSLYIRRRVFSPYGSGWIYTYNQNLSGAPYMEAGDWVRFTRNTTDYQEAIAV